MEFSGHIFLLEMFRENFQEAAVVGQGGLSAWQGEEGLEPAPDWQNSLMVTVRRFVVTSVTTTLVQLGVISGCQSGFPSFGSLVSSGSGVVVQSLTWQTEARPTWVRC